MLLDLYWAIEDWSTFFWGEDPVGQGENIKLIRRKRLNIRELAKAVGCNAKACRDEFEDTVHIDEFRRTVNQNISLKDRTADQISRWFAIKNMERASHLGKLLSMRGIDYLSLPDDTLNWLTIHQRDTVADIQKACRNGLEQAGSITGKSKIEVREEMASPPAKAMASEPTGEKRASQSTTIHARTIPAEKRTKPMTRLEALNFIGWPPHAQNERQARDWLTKSIVDGEYHWEEISGSKRGVYHLDDFPKECWPEIRKSG